MAKRKNPREFSLELSDENLDGDIGVLKSIMASEVIDGVRVASGFRRGEKIRVREILDDESGEGQSH